ncbi:hypothetical protein M0P48_00460 [Candidatus Gracilibacteria bacterium]|nr:hypothetical protein [Candidatus Gracilibacteria bacterium]
MALSPQIEGNREAIGGLNPKLFWENFAALNEHPRDSMHETPALDAIKDWAKMSGFDCKQDKVGNLCVHVPASEGVTAPPVIIQAHIDMVCVKTPESKHDFSKDPIELIKEKDYIKAKDTSLGADNLLGVAAAMAVAEDKTAIHPEMQILITIDEESDFTGAINLDVKTLGLTGRQLINLDTEFPSTLITASAAYCDIVGKLPCERESLQGNEGEYYELKLSGFTGGHSGLDIDKGRGSANMCLIRILQKLSEKGVKIISINGTGKSNSISPFASAEIFVPSHVNVYEINSFLEGEKIEFRRTLKDENDCPNENIKIELTKLDKDVIQNVGAITSEPKGKIFTALKNIPEGVIERSHAKETLGSPESSSNTGFIRVGNDAELKICARSYGDEETERIATGIVRALTEVGFIVELLSKGGSWVGDPNSLLSRTVLQTFERLDGDSGKVERVHGTLEISGIIERLKMALGGDFDAVSFGTTILDQHSTSERVPTADVERFYNHLCGVLEKLATQQ